MVGELTVGVVKSVPVNSKVPPDGTENHCTDAPLFAVAFSFAGPGPQVLPGVVEVMTGGDKFESVKVAEVSEPFTAGAEEAIRIRYPEPEPAGRVTVRELLPPVPAILPRFTGLSKLPEALLSCAVKTFPLWKHVEADPVVKFMVTC